MLCLVRLGVGIVGFLELREDWVVEVLDILAPGAWALIMKTFSIERRLVPIYICGGFVSK